MNRNILVADPGSNFTGIADFFPNRVGQPGKRPVELAQSDNPVDVFRFMRRRLKYATVVLIEDYSAGGYLTAEAKSTLKVVGYLENAFKELLGERVYLVPKNRRLSGMSEAYTLMNEWYPDLSKGPEAGYKDSIAALGHAVVFARS